MSGPASRIFWVEPNRSDRELIEAAVEDLGWPLRLEFLYDCEELVERVRGGPVNLVLIDFGAGLEECTREIGALRKVAPMAPVVVFTGYEGPAERKALLAQGAVEVIQKPTSFEDFRLAVRKAVKHARGVDPPARDRPVGVPGELR